jgi:hypothetical protein
MATTFAVPDGRMAMNAVLRNGFGTSGGSITSLNFQPDFFWEKARNNAYNHQLVDSVRGVSKVLNSNLTDVEGTQATYVTSFNSNGYTLGANDYGTGVTLVDWCWKAGGTAVSNTAGTITSSVSANTTAGFSVVTYTGTGANATVGHGLGVVPGMVIIKSRSVATNWIVYHSSVAATAHLVLNLTDAAYTDVAFNNTAPTSSVFSIGPAGYSVNNSAATYVAYCWAPVAGYSAFGSYTGNGSADGPFIYTGFRPRFVMIKGSSLVSDWNIFDSSRATYNANDTVLFPDLSNAESSPATEPIDFLSNGIKIRNATNATNSSGNAYIYAAFAENPLKYANAR